MTKIEWTEATWNPVVGCSIVSPGCTNCYAMRMAARIEAADEAAYSKAVAAAVANATDMDDENRIRAALNNVRQSSHYAGTTKPSRSGPVWTGKIALAPDHILTEPLRRRKPTMWFVNSMSDLFHESVPDEWIDRVFAVMALAPQHTFQVLTKRSARMLAYMTGDPVSRWVDTVEWKTDGLHWHQDDVRDVTHRLTFGGESLLRNVWLGVSCERQQEADARIPDLLATPAAVRFVSAEPLLGPVDFTRITTPTTNAIINALEPERLRRIGGGKIEYGPPTTTLSWIIVGGESGPGARPMALGWAKDIVRQCKSSGVPVFVKQLGTYPTNREGERCPHIKHKKGADMAEWPEALRVREYPETATVKAEPEHV